MNHAKIEVGDDQWTSANGEAKLKGKRRVRDQDARTLGAGAEHEHVAPTSVAAQPAAEAADDSQPTTAGSRCSLASAAAG
jgi:hypothetical protein